jgi:hypothetical protein
VTSIADTLSSARYDWVFAGATAAAIEGVTLFTEQRPVEIRADVPDGELDRVIEDIGGESVSEAANIVLVRDVGRVGVHGARSTAQGPIAPRSRVWLDLRAGLRGDSTSALYYDLRFGEPR